MPHTGLRPNPSTRSRSAERQTTLLGLSEGFHQVYEAREVILRDFQDFP